MFDCSVHHVDQFTDHPVMKLLARGFAESAECGVSGVPLHWEQSAIYLTDDDGDIVSAIAYRKLQDRNCYWICMGCTAEHQRRNGLYSRLHRALVMRARENGVASVEGEVRNSNLAMMNAAKNQGRMAVSTRWVTYV